MASTTVSTGSSLPRWLTPWAAPRLSPHIAETDVTDVTAPVHANQRVEKSFTITKRDDDDASDSTKSLQIHAPGLTVIRVQPDLLEEVGPDVVARVRVTSDDAVHVERLRVAHDKRDQVEIKYDPKRGTIGHLVTEIDVPRAGDVHQVLAMCRGDVVVTDGGLGDQRPQSANTAVATSPTPGVPDTTPTLLSLLGARLVLDAPTIQLDRLALGCLGGGRVDVVTSHLAAANDVAIMALGRGTINVYAGAFESTSTMLCTLGGGHLSITAADAFRTRYLTTYQRGNGAVGITAPTADACRIQIVGASGTGTVDTADVPACDTSVEVLRPIGAVVRIHAPHEKLSIEGNASGAVHHVGPLPPLVEHKNIKAPELMELEPDSLTLARPPQDDLSPVTIPNIASAFETPVSLEKPSEGWFMPIVFPTLRALLPY